MTMQQNKLFKAEIPEPLCFYIEEHKDHVPKRFVRHEWVEWASVKHNCSVGAALTLGVKRIMEHQFTEIDQQQKEWNHAPILVGKDIEIFIYHVTRTRV